MVGGVPLLVLGGKREMTGGKKLALKQTALCSETRRQTEAFLAPTQE